MANMAKPIPLRVLEGNRGKQAIPKDTPKPEPIRPTCPDFLSPAAKYEWKRVAPQLERLGLLTKIDRAVLAGYCETWAIYVLATKKLHEVGYVKGQKANPYVRIARDALQQIRYFCQEFGMTPSSRSRMSVPGAKDKDEWDDIE